MIRPGDDPTLSIRVAELDDAAGIGRVQIASVHGGLTAVALDDGDAEDDVLDIGDDGFADIRAAAFWADIIVSTENVVLVAIHTPPESPEDTEAQPQERVVGFIAFGPPRMTGEEGEDEESESSLDSDIDAEIHALHVEPGFRGRGLARGLMAAAFRAMAAVNQLAVRAWALADDSDAESFFRHFGATPTVQALALIGDDEIPETAYDWVDIRRVIPRLDNPGDSSSPKI
ncbi:MAG: GNAT family N-acetyltransferase [Alphaproteobacteria bacterium]|nr:GNAT family N-acetyltransferase [Alphaproteobacteria bacterium]MBU0799256.1 GNAT family N-acetyltransferase [Alphaproteobacteria bacterium]MBU0885555.1 GNAT family N-acetyltransferase [Alphaproteobacteria bacterium]MBU1812968.1 GNAT family N-acetyltransferase [Alphaproteobacteria bacterium]